MNQNRTGSIREQMERFLDYEMRASWGYPLWNRLDWITPIAYATAWYFARKVERKHARYQRRSSVLSTIQSARGPYFGFHG